MAKNKKWTNKEWGNLFMLMGLIMILAMFFGLYPASIVSIETPVASVRAEGLSERNVIGLFIGFGLIIVGAFLRFKK